MMMSQRRRDKAEEVKQRAALMARLYEKDGLSLRAIADLMQTTYQNVHGILTRRRIRMRKRGGNTWSHSRHRS